MRKKLNVSFNNYFSVSADTGYLGLIVVGDSAAANFHIPPEWITARLISGKVFQNFPFILGNEFDWPQLSGFSGYLRESR